MDLSRLFGGWRSLRLDGMVSSTPGLLIHGFEMSHQSGHSCECLHVCIHPGLSFKYPNHFGHFKLVNAPSTLRLRNQEINIMKCSISSHNSYALHEFMRSVSMSLSIFSSVLNELS